MTFGRSQCSGFMFCTVVVAAGGCGVSDGVDEPGLQDESEVAQAATPCAIPSFIAGAPTPAGFASLNGGTTGGGAAAAQLVTTLAQFNTAAKGTTAAVIFVSGNLGQGTATIGSNKTIIGCSGTNPTLSGHVGLSSSANVIIRNLNIVGFNCRPPDIDTSNGGQCQNGQDAVTVQKSHNIWFDHDAISDGSDGNLDINHGSDFITVSNTKFFYSTARSDPNDTGAAGHRFSNLIGGSDSNGSEDTGHLHVTYHHNYFYNFNSRTPSLRFGTGHVYDNYFSNSADTAVHSRENAQMLVQNNVFRNCPTPITTTGDSKVDGYVNQSGNDFGGGTNKITRTGSFTNPPYAFNLTPTASVISSVTSGAGVGHI